MRTAFLVALASAAAAPVAIHQITGPEGEGDLWARAQEIATREFSVHANLTVLGVEVVHERLDPFGGRLRPDPGYAFHATRVRLENDGKMDFAASTWHFSALDETGNDVAVELGNAHEDFDASRLGRGHARAGLMYFELPRGSYVTEVRWQGDFGEAAGAAPPYAHP